MKRAATRKLAVLFLTFLTLSCSFERSSAGTVDDVGRTVAVAQPVSRVVTLAPNLTEIVYAAGGGSSLVATDDNSDFPEPARRLPKVGGMQPNVEKIAALKPDLVLASTEGNQPSLAPALAAVSIPLFVLKTDRMNEIAPAIERVGSLLGTSSSQDAASAVRKGIEAQRRTRAKSPRILFAVWADPLYVAGKATFIDDVLSLTGATNAVQVSGWPQYPLESLIAAPPDLILYPAKAVTRDALERLFRARPALLGTIELVPVDDNLFTRPGPRVSEAARVLNQVIDRWANSSPRS
jgi:ABC-type hemin transport system substrate-binding protein